MPENENIHFKSQRDDWETPPELFAALNAEFAFTLDAAASNHNAKVARFLTVADDALTKPWRGSVWLNPPFGRGVSHWIEKAIQSAAEGATVVLLVPARTDSVWFQQLISHADEIRFLARRVTFVGATEPAPFPTAIVVLRPRPSWASGDERVTFSMPTRHKAGVNWAVMRDAH